MTDTENDAIIFTADIGAAHVSNNNVAVADMPALIAKVYAAMISLRTGRPGQNGD
jgi:predicted transcriptional regulator